MMERDLLAKFQAGFTAQKIVKNMPGNLTALTGI